MPNPLDAYKSAFAALPPEIRAAEAEAETGAAVQVTLRDGARQDRSFSDVTSLFVRASGGKTGFAYIQDLKEDPLAVKAGCGSFSKALTFSRPEALEPAMFEAGLQKWLSFCRLTEAAFEAGAYPCVLDAGVMTNILLTSCQKYAKYPCRDLGLCVIIS